MFLRIIIIRIIIDIVNPLSKDHNKDIGTVNIKNFNFVFIIRFNRKKFKSIMYVFLTELHVLMNIHIFLGS